MKPKFKYESTRQPDDATMHFQVREMPIWLVKRLRVHCIMEDVAPEEAVRAALVAYLDKKPSK